MFFIDKEKKRCYNRACRSDWQRGRVAQLGEHWLYKPGVTGSSPVPPTIYFLKGVVVQLGLTRLPVTQEIAGSNPVDPAIQF